MFNVIASINIILKIIGIFGEPEKMYCKEMICYLYLSYGAVYSLTFKRNFLLAQKFVR